MRSTQARSIAGQCSWMVTGAAQICDCLPVVAGALPQLSTTRSLDSVEMPVVSPGHADGSPNSLVSGGARGGVGRQKVRPLQAGRS
jgi:hypothetical protein